jgi:hypothetical protein
MTASETSYKALEKRILQGEKKSVIYASFNDDEHQEIVAAVLSKIPVIVRRRKYRSLNSALIACLVILALLTLTMASSLISSQIVLAVSLLTRFSAISWLIWLVYNYRGDAYFAICGYGLVIILFSTRNESALHSGTLGLKIYASSVVFTIISIILAAILMHLLLPQTTLCMKPKVDRQGKPLFDENYSNPM